MQTCNTELFFMIVFREYVMLHADRLGRPMVFQLSQDVSFGDLVTSLFNSLSDSLREPAVSIYHITQTTLILTSTYRTGHHFFFISLHA